MIHFYLGRKSKPISNGAPGPFRGWGCGRIGRWGGGGCAWRRVYHRSENEWGDDNGRPVGISDIDSTQLKIADRIKNNILPSTLGLFDIVTEEIDNISVIKILISSGLEKPYYISSHVTSESCSAPRFASTQSMY